MTGDTRTAILTTARKAVQKCGYAQLSFRDLAHAVGIKSSSVHYHFPTKSDLGVELMRTYTLAASADLATISAGYRDWPDRLQAYFGLFRRALDDGNRMCLYGVLSAESEALPAVVRDELADFERINIEWLIDILQPAPEAANRARSIFATAIGAQILARAQTDIARFDAIAADVLGVMSQLTPPK